MQYKSSSRSGVASKKNRGGGQEKLLRALALHEQGELQQAETIYQEILRSDPKNFDALHLYGVIYFQKNDYKNSIYLIKKAIDLYPANSIFYSNLGNSLKAIGDFDSAIISYLKAIKINPNAADTYTNLGSALHEQKKYGEALKNHDRAIDMTPQSAVAHFNRGVTLQAMGQLTPATAAYQQAIKVQPQFAPGYINLGVLHVMQNQLSQALVCYDRALQLSPGSAEAYINRGKANQELGAFGAAMADFEQAVALNPQFAAAHWNKSLLLLLQGDFEQGWPLYEWRWQTGDTRFVLQRQWSKPRWSGAEALDNKTLLIHSEQGLGDTLQFCRYIKLAAQRGARVVLEVTPPLMGLMSTVEHISELVVRGQPLPAYDYHCPMLSLPFAFGTSLSSVPACLPYLFIEQSRSRTWQEHIGTHGFKIGISWQGNTAIGDPDRSFQLRLLENISKLAEVRLISLQKNAGAEQLLSLPQGMVVEQLPADFDNGANAFLDTAALLVHLDLVISCDTSLGHLAGGLGLPVWLALRHVPDWRWMLNRNDSPWYPKHRLFRQPTHGDWASVFNDMELQLGVLLKTQIKP